MRKIKSPQFLSLLIALLIAFACFLNGCSLPDWLKPNRLKVLVVGIDGMDPSLVDSYLSQGHLPNLQKVISHGLIKYIPTELDLISPVIWTSIATGVPPKVHGIEDFVMQGKPVNSSSRKVPAFWNILNYNKIKAATLGWWATWPAEKEGGIIIGDRVHWRDRKEKIYPPDIIDTDKYTVDRYKGNLEFLSRFTSYPYEPNFQNKFSENDENYILNKLISERLIKNYCIDKIYTDIAKEITTKNKIEVMSVYFLGIDYVSHAFWQYMDPNPFREDGITVQKKNIDRLGKIIPEYYKHIDELLGELLNICDENTLIFILSDHGFGPDPNVVHDTKSLGLSGNHRNEAVFIVSGKDVQAPDDKQTATTTPRQFDFLPTLLFALNLPIAKDLTGRPLTEYFTNEFSKAHGIKPIPTYTNIYRSTAAPPPLGDDAKVIKDLKGLGYVK